MKPKLRKMRKEFDRARLFVGEKIAGGKVVKEGPAKPQKPKSQNKPAAPKNTKKPAKNQRPRN